MSEHTGPACTFHMLDADFVRGFEDKSLPFFQEIKQKHPDALVDVTLNYAQVVQGLHFETILSVSHRWMQPNDPDPDGEQLSAIKTFLSSDAGRKIKLLWIDAACMPQDHPKGSRSAEDTAAFKTMLSEVNMLYLGTSVLILLDLSYVSRFWTQFESWLAMQYAMPDGLKPAINTQNERHHIMCIHNAASQAELYTKGLVENWAHKTPQQAHAFLAKPDVTVTNQSDKEGQLLKIEVLDATVQGAFKFITYQQTRELASWEDRELATKAALAAWEKDNDAAAGESNVLKVEAREAARGVVMAREAKESHEGAIKLGVVPARLRLRESAAGALKAAMLDHTKGWPAQLETAVKCARMASVDEAAIEAAEDKLRKKAADDAAAAAIEKVRATEALEAAMPGMLSWFTGTDFPKLESAVKRARAAGVVGTSIDAAERELQKERMKQQAEQQAEAERRAAEEEARRPRQVTCRMCDGTGQSTLCCFGPEQCGCCNGTGTRLFDPVSRQLHSTMEQLNEARRTYNGRDYIAQPMAHEYDF